MNAYVSETMRLDHLRREPAPSALYREQLAGIRGAGRVLRPRVNAAELDELRLAAIASIGAGFAGI